MKDDEGSFWNDGTLPYMICTEEVYIPVKTPRMLQRKLQHFIVYKLCLSKKKLIAIRYNTMFSK